MRVTHRSAFQDSSWFVQSRCYRDHAWNDCFTYLSPPQNIFCMMMIGVSGMVDRWKAFGAISNRQHRQRSSIIANLRQAASRIWTCAESEFRPCWMKDVRQGTPRYPVSHLVAISRSWGCNFITKETQRLVFSCEICKNFKNTFFQRTPPDVTSERNILKLIGKVVPIQNQVSKTNSIVAALVSTSNRGVSETQSNI